MIFRHKKRSEVLGCLIGLYIIGEKNQAEEIRKKGEKKKKQSNVGGVDPTIRQETADEMVWVTLSKK